MRSRRFLFRRSLLAASLLAGFQAAYAQTSHTVNPAAEATATADTSANSTNTATGDGEVLTEVMQPVQITATEFVNRVVNEKGYKAERTDVTGVDTSILDTPYSIDVVTQEQLQDKRPETLEESLKGISGISQGNNLAGTLDTVKRRGYGGNRDGSIMRNGMPSALARNFTATAERVEVLKGPASVLYGMQDGGGIVNVVSKKPNHKEYKRGVSANYGSFANRQIGADFTGPIGTAGFAYRLIADYKTKNYWRNFGKNTEYVIAPSLSWENGTSRVLASYEYQNYEGTFDRGIFLDTNATVAGAANPNYLKTVNVPLETRLDDPINVTRGHSHTFQLRGEHKLSPNWTLKGEYGFSKNHYSDWQARVTGFNYTNAGVARVRHRVDSTDPSDVRTHNLNLSALGTFMQGNNIVHKMRASLQLHDYKLTLGDLKRSGAYWMPLQNFLDGTAYGSSALLNAQASSTPNAGTSDTLEQYKTASILLQDTVYLGDKWIVSGGLRGQYHRINSGQGRGTSKFRNKDSGFNLLPQIGAVYLINPSWSVYGNYGLSAKPNPSRSWNYQGEEIKLEKTRQFEIGSKYNGEKLSATVALFHINKKDTAKRYTDANGDQVIRIAGEDRSKGLEIDVNGRLTDRIGISANYTYTDTRVKRDDAVPLNVGTRFDSVPQHMGGVLLTYDFGHAAGGKWRVGAGLDYLGSWGFNYVANNRATWVKMPSATVYNAFVSYDTKVGGKDLNIRLTGKNLGNKRYLSNHATATMEHLAIGAPREIGVRAQLRF